MPQAWNARLSDKEQEQFSTLYGAARIQEGVQTKLVKLLLSSLAPGTINNYIAVINKWLKFARRHSFREFPIAEDSFSQYLTELMDQGAPYSSFKLLKAAIPFYYEARNSTEQCVTKSPFIKRILEGALRISAKNRGPVKKAVTFAGTEIKSLLSTVFWPSGSSSSPNKSLKDWRTGVRLYTYYFSLCRWDCYSKLTMNSIEFHHDYLTIFYDTRKNDKHYTGSSTILKYRGQDLLCPKLIYRTYFNIMKFTNGTDFLNCRLTWKAAAARPTTKLSYSESLKTTKELLGRFGYDGSEKSFKASGVTILLDSQVPLTDVQVYGGWRSQETPLYYHNSSVKRRKEVSAVL